MRGAGEGGSPLGLLRARGGTRLLVITINGSICSLGSLSDLLCICMCHAPFARGLVRVFGFWGGGSVCTYHTDKLARPSPGASEPYGALRASKLAGHAGKDQLDAT